MIKESQKITLTFGQLKRLVAEARSNGGDGIFHAKNLIPYGFEYRPDVDVYDLNDRKARFYALDGSDVGFIYSRHGKTSTLVPHNAKFVGVRKSDRENAISGNYETIVGQLDRAVEALRRQI